MQKIDQIDQTIKKLTQKKHNLESQRAVSLVKTIDQIFEMRIEGDVLLGLVTWAKKELDTNPHQAEVWRRLSPKFRGASSHSNAAP